MDHVCALGKSSVSNISRGVTSMINGVSDDLSNGAYCKCNGDMYKLYSWALV